jgi:hypothetical protein
MIRCGNRAQQLHKHFELVEYSTATRLRDAGGFMAVNSALCGNKAGEYRPTFYSSSKAITGFANPDFTFVVCPT